MRVRGPRNKHIVYKAVIMKCIIVRHHTVLQCLNPWQVDFEFKAAKLCCLRFHRMLSVTNVLIGAVGIHYSTSNKDVSSKDQKMALHQLLLDVKNSLRQRQFVVNS